MEFLALPAWLWWVALAVLLVLIDLGLLGAQFILFSAAVAALAAAGAAWLGLALAGQLWTFVIALLVLTPVLIYWLRPNLRGREPGPLESGWERGQRVTVHDRGERKVARLKGDDYPVLLSDGGQPDAGEQLIVDHMEGITLIVRRLDNSGEARD